MKVQITENDINKMVAEAIMKIIGIGSNTLFEATQNIESKDIDDIKKDIKNKIADMIKSGDQNLRDIADNIGINLDYDKKDAFNLRNKTIDRTGQLTSTITDEVAEAAGILSQYAGNSGRFDSSKMKEDYPDRFNELMRMKDFIDQMRMTHIYDKAYFGNNKAKRNRLNGKYGVMIDKDGNVDISGMDFNSVSDAEIADYRKAGNSSDLSDFEVIMRKRISVIDKYMSSKYGLQVNMPKGVFTAGNTKLPSDTLIINFTSAERCPAWNECLVKHACYARAIENLRQNVRDANTQRSLMWQAGQSDPQLMQMLFDLVKAYIFDYAAAVPEIAALKNREIGRVNSKSLRAMSLRDMHPQVIEILKKHKRINDIRLNENGDFIGQWLLEAWDVFAEELKIAEVSTAAYTCRFLQFDKIKNIIINASSEAIKGPSVARYFFAVSEEMYDLFDETYAGEGNALTIATGEDGKARIQMNLQPLFNPKTNQPNGKFYYKCPCGRDDGLIGTGEKAKADCYMCRTCYQPNDDPRTQGKPYYVLVKVHGSNHEDFGGRGELPSFGVSKSYMEKKLTLDLQKRATKKQTKSKLNEGVGNNTMNNAQNAAIQQVVNNAVISINNHLAQL